MVVFEIHFSFNNTNVTVVEIMENFALIKLLEFGKHSLVKRVGVVEARVLALKSQELNKLRVIGSNVKY
jgi:hypothetical protein